MADDTFLPHAVAEKQRFLRALTGARGEEERLFKRYVRDNAETVFGREHGFAALRTLDDFRRAVPIRSYESFLPWLERAMAGERAVLTRAPPLVFFSTTGTTGAPKLVPATREFLIRRAKSLLVFWANIGEACPEAFERDDTLVMLSLAPKPYARWTKGGIPIHNSTEMPATTDGGLPFSRSPWFPPPPELSDADRLYYLVRRSIESEVIGVVSMHSSRLQAFASLMDRETPRLIAEVHDGVVVGRKLGEANPNRAHQLEHLLTTGPLTPSRVWPSFRFISCWVGPSFELYRADLERDFTPHIFPQMTASSELGSMTTSVDLTSLDGILTVDASLYEFLPEEEVEGGGGRTLGFHELEIGRTYEMITTTCSGLYRYRCGDRFEVTGFIGDVPRLAFAGRSGASDLAGEKVTEQHVGAALKEVLATSGLVASGATFCAVWGKPSHYIAFIEPTTALSTGSVTELERKLDDAIQRQAPRYSMKRKFGDLGPLVLRVAPRGTFAAYRARRVADGVVGTQLKDKILHFPHDKSAVATLEQLAQALSDGIA